MLEEINAKWSEDLPVLYEIAIFIQEEFMEGFIESGGLEE